MAGRVVLILLGLAGIVVGGVFAAQGAGVLPGSFMTNDRTWLYIGLALVVAGIVLLALGFRRRRRRVQR